MNGLEQRFDMLYKIVGVSLDATQAKRMQYKRKGYGLRISMIILTMLATMVTGLKWSPFEINIAFIITTILVAVTAIDALFSYIEQYNNYTDFVTETTKIYTEMELCRVSGIVTEEEYLYFKKTHEETNERFQNKRKKNLQSKDNTDKT